jgi:hypothetical protein
VLAFACSNRASGSTHRSSQSNTNAVLIPSKFNAFPQNTHSLRGVFSLISSFVFYPSFRGNSSLSFSSDVRTRTLVSTASKQSKEGRHPLSLSSPHTDHRRIARVHRVKTQPNRPSFSYPSKVHFLSEPIGRTVSLSLCHSLSLCRVSLSLSLYRGFFLRTSFSSLTNR